MSHSNKVQSIIEQAVGEVFQAALPNLRAEIVDRAARELQALEPAPGSLPADLLNAATSSIQESSSQAEILRHLLEGAGRFCGRAALFVIKSGAMSGWQGSGFDSDDVVKGFSSASTTGLAAAAIQERAPISGKAEEFDAGFLGVAGAPTDAKCLVVPLVVKEKVAALIYADAGKLPDSTVDVSALTLLCRFTSLWLELTALRKAGAAAAEDSQAASAAAVAGTAAAQGNSETVAVAEEDELHKKARRYARLLVDEIKLYNQSKVAEGKNSKDLYDRLKDDIEKSREAYEKRYGTSPAASANYFTQELIRILADNDISLMGGGFPR
jgi:hypothetical protein